jgi:hypothetical protein
MLARMEWDDLFGALIGLQQLECVAQVFLPEGDSVPVLTTIGRFGGGPIGQLGSSDTIVLELQSSGEAGPNGVLMIQETHFESAEQPTPTSLTIMYQGLTILLTCSEDADEDDWHADE